MCSGRVDSPCSTSDTGRVTLVAYPVISHEWRNDRIVITTIKKSSVLWFALRFPK